MTRSSMICRELVRVEDVEATLGFSMVSVAHEFGKWKIHPSQKYELIMPTCFKVDVGRPVAFHDARVRTWKPCNNHSNDKRSELPLSNDELSPIWVLQELISKKVNKLIQVVPKNLASTLAQKSFHDLSQRAAIDHSSKNSQFSANFSHEPAHRVWKKPIRTPGYEVWWLVMACSALQWQFCKTKIPHFATHNQCIIP